MPSSTDHKDGTSPYSNCLFDQPWWLDAVAPGEWDDITITKGGNIIARWPYVLRRIWGQKAIMMPGYTQTLGPWVEPSSGKYVTRLSKEKEILLELIEKLPPYDYFSQCFHHSQTNWLPFYWKEFSQMTLYTYLIDDIENLELVWKGFRENIRTDVRKAKKALDVRSDFDIEEFLRVQDMTYARQSRNRNAVREMILRIDDACKKQNACKIFCAVDSKERIHAASYIVWDERSAHYLMGGGDPELRNSGAHSLVLWEAIRFASTVTRRFDFEGSMVESIERFFRAFGARQVPYFKITRCKSPLVKAGVCLKSFLRR